MVEADSHTPRPAPADARSKHVVFGKVVAGEDVVRAVEKMETGDRDQPVQVVTITDCGELPVVSHAAGPPRSRRRSSPLHTASQDQGKEDQTSSAMKEEEEQVRLSLLRAACCAARLTHASSPPHAACCPGRGVGCLLLSLGRAGTGPLAHASMPFTAADRPASVPLLPFALARSLDVQAALNVRGNVDVGPLPLR